MHREWGIPHVLSLILSAAMAAQAALGRLFPEQYRDPEWIRATWFGNDWVTLLLGVPLLTTGLLLARRGSCRGRLLWLGMLAYGIYNYGFYMLGAALNVFFPLYVVPFVLSVVTLILALSGTSAQQTAARFRPGTPVRLIGGYLLLVAAALAGIWMTMWAAYAFAGRPTPIEPEAFKIVAALDLGLMVPALALGGLLLWRRKPWGYLIAAIAGAQGSLYLLVLAVNSLVAIRRGLTEAPGELPVWGPLALATAAATALLFAAVRDPAAPAPSEPAPEPSIEG